MNLFNVIRLICLLALLQAASAFALPSDCNALLSGDESLTSTSKKNTVINYSEHATQNSFREFVKKTQDKDQLRWTYANIFLDRDQIAVSTSRESEDLASLWDESHYLFFTKSPLNNFKSAYETFILNQQDLSTQTFNLELIKEFHSAMMNKGIEGISSSNIGKIRTSAVVFFTNKKLLDRDRVMLMRNPFLRIGTPDGYGRIMIEYPVASSVPKMLDALFSEHESALMAAKSLEQRVKAHTDFVWTFVSIHPFANGNGRTSRFILDYLLAKEGLSPPLLADSIDLTLTKEKFFEKVLLGVKNTDLLVADLAWRISEGLDPKQSPYNLAAKLPAKVWFASEGTRGKKVPFVVDLYDYSQFVRDHNGRYSREITFLRDYVEWLKNWSVHFADRAGELQPYQVRRIPEELISLWKNESGRSLQGPQSIELFYKNFYEPSELHRGLSLRTSMSDQELVDYFKTVKNIDLSMNASRNGGSLSAIVSDFKKFNQLMNEPENLFQYARDHMNAEGLYSKSPFNSTSKLYAVADRFSRGFMMSSEWITSMKGQLTVSALRPKYGVMDFNRLREIAEKTSSDDAFKSRYPRQQEVAVAGSIHPASITRVEFRDVTVLEAVDNSGEKIAGKTEIKQVRVLTRLKDEPNKIKFEKFDGKGKLLSEEIISLF